MGQGDETILRTPTGRLRLRWLLSNALRVTHATSGEEPFPTDRPWLADILPPSELSPASPELGVAIEQDCLRAADPEGREIFAERRPPRMSLKHSRFEFSLDPTKAELRMGFRRVEGGVRLSLETTPDESFYGWGEQFDSFRRQEGRIRLKIRDAIAPLQRHFDLLDRTSHLIHRT